MLAVVIARPGGPEVLEIRSVADPVPGPGQVLVRVSAVGLNRADLLQCRGRYPAPPGFPPDIPGLEYAGEVVQCGPGTRGCRPGDRVMGIVGGGACAEYVVVHERETVAVPDHVSLTSAAAIPEAFFTAFDALFLQCRLTLGETVLIHASGSGVGTAAIQLASAAGCRTVGTARSQAKLDAARSLGLDHGVLVRDGRFLEAVREALDGSGVDVVMDFVGGPYLEQNLLALVPGGRLIVVGLLGGPRADLSLGTLLTRRLMIRGTTLRARPLEEKIALARRFEREVLPLLVSGRIRPVIDRTLPMSEVRTAHAMMGRNETFGKLVLVWD